MVCATENGVKQLGRMDREPLAQNFIFDLPGYGKFTIELYSGPCPSAGLAAGPGFRAKTSSGASKSQRHDHRL